MHNPSPDPNVASPKSSPKMPNILLGHYRVKSISREIKVNVRKNINIETVTKPVWHGNPILIKVGSVPRVDGGGSSCA